MTPEPGDELAVGMQPSLDEGEQGIVRFREVHATHGTSDVE